MEAGKKTPEGNVPADGQISAPPPKRFRFGKRALVLWSLFGCLLLIAFSQRAILSFVLREALLSGLTAAGMEVLTVEVDASIGRALEIRNLRVRGSGENKTHLEIKDLSIAPVRLTDLFASRERLLARVSAGGLSGVLDLRTPHDAVPVELPSSDEQARLLDLISRVLPMRFELDTSEVRILLDDLSLSIQGGALRLVEHGYGYAGWESLSLEAGTQTLTFPASRSVTSWNNGTLVLADWELLPMLRIHSLAVNLFQPGAVCMELDAKVFDGWVRGNAKFGTAKGVQPIELDFQAGNLDVPSAADFFQIVPARDVSGVVNSLQAGFRGDLTHPKAGNGTLRIEASQVSWQGRGVEEAIIGLRLEEGRLILSEFSLKQGENRIAASGEMLWPEEGNFPDPEAFQGELRATASIPNFAAFAALAGAPFSELEGLVELRADLRWNKGSALGSIDFRASDCKWRGTALGSVGLRAGLNAEEVKIAEFSWRNENDTALISGTFRFTQPFDYSGSAAGCIENIGRYSALPGAEALAGATGSLRMEWQGSGTTSAHSGTWNLVLEDASTVDFPGGVSGSFAGNYFPDFLHSECRLLHKNLELSFGLSAGDRGIHAGRILLRTPQTSLLDGEIYLPWNPLILLSGKDWTEGLLPGKNLYADMRTQNLRLRELGLLLGQEVPADVEFSGHLAASGPVESPEMAAGVQIRSLVLAESGTMLLERGAIKASARDGRAKVSGMFVLPAVENVRLEPVTMELGFPFGAAVRNGALGWSDPLGELQGKILLPSVDLSRFSSLVPDVRRLSGVVSGGIELGRSLANPSIEGGIELRDGLVEINRQLPVLRNLRAALRFNGDRLRIENAQGEIGAGPFQITGGASWSGSSGIAFDVRFLGEQVLLHRDRAMRLRADVDLTLRGAPESAAITGSVLLVDGRIFQRLEITPLLQGAGPETGSPLFLPDLSGLVPPPFADWKLDVEVANKNPFLVVGNLASGSIEPALRIVGRLGDPRPTGRVTLRDVRAFLPFATVTIPEGVVEFDQDSPRSADLDIRGFSRVLEYDIVLSIDGPLEEKNLVLRSDPPLSQEQILLLLTAGIAPGSSSGAGAGQAVVGQGGLLVLRALMRNFEPDGVDVDSLINRLQVFSAPPALPDLRSTLRGEFRFTDRASVYMERDGLGFFGGGLTYRLRFR